MAQTIRNMKDQEIDKLFRDKLMDKEITPSANAWATLDQQLGQQNNRRRIAFWWSSAAAVLTGLGLATGLYYSQLPSGEVYALSPAAIVFTENPLPAAGRTVTGFPSKNAEGSDDTSLKPAVLQTTQTVTVANQAKKKQITPASQDQLHQGRQPEQQEPSAEQEEELIIAQHIQQEAKRLANSSEEITMVIKLEAEGAQPEIPQEKKRSKAGRILEQLKNLKNGGEVDPRAFGINADKIVISRHGD